MPATILIVDDEPATLIALSIMLRKQDDFNILTVNNAADGMRLAAEKKPALIISDYHMTPVNGFEFCRQIKSHPTLFDTMFVLLTSSDEPGIKVKGLENGADDFFAKPFNAEELRSKIRALLRIKALQDEVRREKNDLERLQHATRESLSGIMALVGRVIGLRVPNASDRAKVAARMAGWIARRLNQEESKVHEIETAALIHEIGKIVLPDELLRKPFGQMTPEERGSWQEFPILGQRLVEEVAGMEEISHYLRHQMENYGGNGYPDRLMKIEIPLPSRILRVILFIEERLDKGMSMDDLIDDLHDAQGVELDPTLVALADEYVRVELNKGWQEGKRQVSPLTLKPGMVLASDLFTGSGSKLLPKGTQLTPSYIAKIISIQESDPIINEIYVLEQ